MKIAMKVHEVSHRDGGKPKALIGESDECWYLNSLKITNTMGLKPGDLVMVEITPQ